MAKKSNRREFLQLAKTFNLDKDDPSGMYISEKLDGMRVFWDGGISRGVPTVQVPWASIMDPKKPGELKKKIKPVATGLWSRYGNPIIAPDWWLNRLPQMFLDGELFAGRGNFQTCMSITKKDVAVDAMWQNVQFAVFGAPSAAQVFASGEIKNPNFHLEVSPDIIGNFMRARIEAGVAEEFIQVKAGLPFEQELSILQSSLPQDDLVYLHRHILLPDDRAVAERHMNAFMDVTLAEGGEGVMLRDAKSLWTPKRVKSLLKLKPFTDDQAVVTGFTSGRQTDKGSKLRGLIGAVITEYDGKRLEIAGLTNEERKFADDELTAHAWKNPGEDMPPIAQGKHFKVGDTMEFRYRELSDAGIPKDARYLRKVNVG
jgi:DNA ligase-1